MEDGSEVRKQHVSVRLRGLSKALRASWAGPTWGGARRWGEAGVAEQPLPHPWDSCPGGPGMGDRGTSDGLGESVPERKWWVCAGGVSLPLPPTGHFLSWGHPAGPGAASHPSPPRAHPHQGGRLLWELRS